MIDDIGGRFSLAFFAHADGDIRIGYIVSTIGELKGLGAYNEWVGTWRKMVSPFRARDDQEISRRGLKTIVGAMTIASYWSWPAYQLGQWPSSQSPYRQVLDNISPSPLQDVSRSKEYRTERQPACVTPYGRSKRAVQTIMSEAILSHLPHL